MNKLNIRIKDIQKAYEDVTRDAFDYFLDLETGEVIIISDDIISVALKIMEEAIRDDEVEFEEIEFDREYEIPEWVEGEVELALDIFLYQKERYVRIPEREPHKAFDAMMEFTGLLPDGKLRQELLFTLQGKGAFRRFKSIISRYATERKMWYAHNTRSIYTEINEWLRSLGIG